MHNDPNDSLQVPPTIAQTDAINDAPIPTAVLEPLVSQLLSGYRHADILLLLPGFIPIPSFFQSISLPATPWVDPSTNKFRPDVESLLLASPMADPTLHPSIPFPASSTGGAITIQPSKRKPPRTVKRAPLLVRPASPHIYTPEGRSKLLSSIGIPERFHDPARTHVLVVSFGGQIIHRPHGGRSPSRTPSPPRGDANSLDDWTRGSSNHLARVSQLPEDPPDGQITSCKPGGGQSVGTLSRRTSTKIFIPGAPAPANNPASPTIPNHSSSLPPLQFLGADGTQIPSVDVVSLPCPPVSLNATQEDEPSLLPSSAWIAIICGVSSNWSVSGDEEELPPGFYIAPRDVYMPDLTVVADVLMGKLVCDILATGSIDYKIKYL